MKVLQFTLAIIAVCFLFAGCGPLDTLVFESPDGSRKVVVKGERGIVGDPIHAEATLVGPNKTHSYKFDFPAGSMTYENVKAKWMNDFRVTLTFTMSDGMKFDVECLLLEDKYDAVKMLNTDMIITH
jgi:hypothetical protein